MKTATNIYIFNLALADALATSTLPFQSVNYLMGTWPFGDVLCKMVLSIDYYNMFTSIFTLTTMSIDRYIAVCHPVKALDFRTPRNAKIVNVCNWILSSAIGLPVMFMASTVVTYHTPAGIIDCTLIFPHPSWYWENLLKICVFIFAFIMPVLIITVCYGLMILRLKSVRMLSGSKEKDRNLRRITRMVLVVVAVFIVCWTPIHIFVIIKALVNIPSSLLQTVTWHFCIALGYTNSSLNPVLYAFLDENFKRCFREFCATTPSVLELQNSSRAGAAGRNLPQHEHNSAHTGDRTNQQVGVCNAAARLLIRSRRSCHITPILAALHWLAVHLRAHFKVLVVTYRAIHGQAPAYISELIQPYSLSRSLRSSDQGRLWVPRTRLKTKGDRAFATAAPRLWNALLQDLNTLPSENISDASDAGMLHYDKRKTIS
ncbi:mu-type opioid receptor [Diretmus argenteus]